MHKTGKNGLPKGFYWKAGVIYKKIWHDHELLGVFSMRTADTYEAERNAAKKLEELLKRRNEVKVELRKGVRIAEILHDYVAHLERREQDSGAYMTNRKYESSSYKVQSVINAHLAPAFGDLKPEELTTDALIAHKTKRNRQGAKTTSTNGEFRILRAAMNRGTKSTPKKVHPLHVPDFTAVINDKADKKAARTGTISDEQFAAIMEHASEHLKPVFVTAIDTGMRGKEIKFVRRDQVNFEANRIYLLEGETKNTEARTIPMNDRLKSVLMAWEAKTETEHPSTPWFFHQNGEQLGNWKTTWNATLLRAGLRVERKGKMVNLVKFHDTRRTATTSMDEIGLDEKDIMKVGGHKTTAMSRRYNQSEAALERVRLAQNTALGFGVATPVAVTSVASAKDWKAELKELKAMMDDGILTAEDFATEKARVMANR